MTSSSLLQLAALLGATMAAALLLLSLPVAAATIKPHIVSILADDLGWGNVCVSPRPAPHLPSAHPHWPLTPTCGHGCPLLCCRSGWNRAVPTKEVATPVLDGLVAEGIELTNFYAFKYCSPTRSALQSGRNPIHVNVVNGPVTCHNPNDTQTAGYSGIALNMSTLPEKMRLAGYVPHAVGERVPAMAIAQTPAGCTRQPLRLDPGHRLSHAAADCAGKWHAGCAFKVIFRPMLGLFSA